MRLSCILLCLYLLGCTPARHHSSADEPSVLQPYIDSVRKTYAPDQRTVWFNVQAQGTILKGETISPGAKASLLKSLEENKLSFTDSISVLPSAELQNKLRGIITVSVANLRTQPSHKAELASQATMGTPVKIWKREKGWYFVQTPDHYLGWMDGSAIERMDETTYLYWQKASKLIYTQPYGFAYTDTTGEMTVCDLVYGDLLNFVSVNGSYAGVMLPGNRKAYVPAAQCMRYDEWRSSRQPAPGNIIASAKKLMGVPYLWGGTSFKGVDCSGFTKTAFFMNGLVLPRDASQQVQLGEEIDTHDGWQRLQPGDLLFFGSPARDDKPEQVVHVGIWIGNSEFIHSAGMVHISSFDPAAANYDANERRRFLRAKRVTPATSLYDLRAADVF